MRGVDVDGARRHTSQSEAIFPPVSPVSPMTTKPRAFATSMARRLFGEFPLVEIATNPEATRRIAREERRRRGEAVAHGSTLEARGPPRGPPGQLTFAFR